MNKVWESRLDNRYDIYVTRVGDSSNYEGELVIEESGNVLHREHVTLSYGAIFGPDVADVEDWENRAIRFVDSLSDEQKE